MSKTFFNDKPPKKGHIKGLRGSSAFKSNNAPKYNYTFWPHTDLLCNASRPCKYIPMTRSLNNESPFLKSLRKYPIIHKSNDAYVDDPIAETLQKYNYINLFSSSINVQTLVDHLQKMTVLQSSRHPLLVCKLFIDGSFTGVSSRTDRDTHLESVRQRSQQFDSNGQSY